MSLRSFGRQLVIRVTTGAGLDAFNRSREQDLIRRHGRALTRVLFFHRTPARHRDEFRQQLAWLRSHFELIDFATFTQRLGSRGSASADRPAMLLTFDDGFVSNYEVAAPLLEQMGVRGVFFVVPAFSLSAPDASRAFHREQLHGREDRYERAMTPEEIRDLAERGHTIGNHTFSHLRLSAMPADGYRHQILDAADIIESWIGRPVDAFAWPYVWNGITPAAHRLAAGRHRYCFSPCAGLMDHAEDVPALVWRTGAEVDRGFREFRFQASGLADHAGAARRRHLRRLLAEPGAIMRPAPA
jgi:peptidoglycan/xylan/chitin deacetylase (PgdA/CDA1 family)